MITTTIEDLTAWLPKFLPFPRILLIRFYPPGIAAVEPNPYCFAVVAVVRRRTATIKGLCGGVSSQHLRSGARALAAIGVHRLEWRHDGTEHKFDTLSLNQPGYSERNQTPNSKIQWI